VLDFGTRIQYPASIFTSAGKPEKRSWTAVRVRVTVELAVAADWHLLWRAGLVRLTSPDAGLPVSSTKTEGTDTLSASFQGAALLSAATIH
jgi:hypothetical protein